MSFVETEETKQKQQVDWKMREKEKQILKKERSEQRRQQMIQTVSKEQLEYYDMQHSIFKMKKIEEHKEQRKIARENLQNAPKLVVDLAYYDLMNQGEIRSLQQQLLFCYGVSNRVENPLRLVLTNYNDEIMHMSKIDGFYQWSADIITQKLDEMETTDFVYLSADSSNIIDEYDPKKTYIIGGLVDKNRYKNVANSRAQKLNIETGCINIKAFVKLSSSQVITVNQIFELMSKAYSQKSMGKAVTEVVPQRKVQEIAVKTESVKLKKASE